MNQSIFNQHKNNPQNFGRPAYSSSFFKWSEGEKELEVYLDIDKYDSIKEFSYHLKNLDYWLPFFSMVSEEVQGLSLDEAKELSLTDLSCYEGDEEDFPFYPLPIYCLHKAIDEYKGNVVSHSIREDLICRCFGVSKNKIETLLRQNLKYGIREISEKTQATTGCSSCLEDVEDIIFENQLSHVGEIVSSYGGEDAFLEKINSTSLQFLKENSLNEFYKVEVLERINLDVRIKITPENKKENLLVGLESYLKDNLGLSISLIF